MGDELGELSGPVIEAAIAVHRELGPGFLESIYETAMKTSLRHRGMLYESQKEVAVVFEGPFRVFAFSRFRDPSSSIGCLSALSIAKARKGESARGRRGNGT
jgi:hypothetical protein